MEPPGIILSLIMEQEKVEKCENKKDKKEKWGCISKIFLVQSTVSAQYIFVNLMNIFEF